MKRVLIAGIGNIFLGDDAFGPEALQLLAARSWPEGVMVRDFGLRCQELAYSLVEGWDGAVVMDAISRDACPGTLFHLLLNDGEAAATAPSGGHGINLAQVLQQAHQLLEATGSDGGAARSLPPLHLVGCQPLSLEPAEGEPLSAPVAAALPRALAMARQIVTELLTGAGPCPATPGIPLGLAPAWGPASPRGRERHRWGGRAASFAERGPPSGLSQPFAPTLPAVQTARLPRLASNTLEVATP